MRRALEDAVKLYIITPTFPRINQISEITRVGQSIKVGKNLNGRFVNIAPLS